MNETGQWYKTYTIDFADKYFFSYKYNHRQQVIEKKVPGAAPLWMVYDNRDRLVASQDGKQREKAEWAFTKYDAVNRAVISGVISDTRDREALQIFVNGLSGFYEDRVNTTNTSSLGYTLTNSFPTNAASTDVLSVTYYDNYLLDHIYEQGDYSFIDDFSQNPDFAITTKVKGLVTGGMTKILGTETWLRNVEYYDDKHRPIQSHYETHLGKDRTSNLYDFAGNVLQTKNFHGGPETKTIARNYEYDHADRLVSVTHQINGGAGVKLASNTYNELGDLIKKDQHAIGGEVPAQSIDYAYNIRGWLTHINDADRSDHNDLFGMELYYDYGFDKTWHNGNIAGVKWKGSQDDVTCAYGYDYDFVGRLKGADYIAGGTANWSSEADRFDVGNINYDDNGNILGVARNGSINLPGVGIETFGKIDDLTYTYIGNQLLTVEDQLAAAPVRMDFSNRKSIAEEYKFDENGNMLVDENKGMGNITYNLLNLPELVEMPEGNSIRNTYDANGTKLSQQLFDGETPGKKTDYLGEFHYEDGVLATIQHEEGRIIPKPLPGSPPSTSWTYQYHLKDHLGNVRLTYTTEPITIIDNASNEPAYIIDERSEFLNYDKVTRINSALFDHTKEADSHYSMRLSGSEKERIGLARSFKVMRGDTIRAAVFAKYLEPDKNQWVGALSDVMLNIAAATDPTGAVIEAVLPTSEQGVFPFAGLLTKPTTDDADVPQAYLNYLVFDKNMVLIEGGYKKITEAAKENGSNIAHEELSEEIVIDEPRYVYIYIYPMKARLLPMYFSMIFM